MRLFGGKLLLRSKTRPIAIDHAGAATLGDVASLVGRTGVDDYDLIGPFDCLAGVANVGFFVTGNDGRGDLHLNWETFLFAPLFQSRKARIPVLPKIFHFSFF